MTRVTSYVFVIKISYHTEIFYSVSCDILFLSFTIFLKSLKVVFKLVNHPLYLFITCYEKVIIVPFTFTLIL